jgi:hypothetical protein
VTGGGIWRRCTLGDEDGVVPRLPKANQDDEDVRAEEGEGEEQKRGGRAA